MHRKTIVILAGLLFACPDMASAGQQLEDMVILSNGDIIRGQITEQTASTLTIVNRDLQSATYPRSDIFKISRETINLKSPKLATGLSFLIYTGIGQWYNGDVTKGLLFFTWGSASLIAAISEGDNTSPTPTTAEKMRFAGGLASWAICMAVGAYDAHRSARRKNRERYGPLYEFGEPRISFQIAPGYDPNSRLTSVQILATF